MSQAEFGGKLVIPFERQVARKARTIKERIMATPLPFKIGFGVAATALAVMGSSAIIPVTAGLGGLAAYYKLRKPSKYSACMSPERVKVYEQAINTLKDPKKLRILADEFEKAGCAKEAEHLRKRAGLRDRPKKDVEEDRRLYRETMQSTDPKRVAKVAEHFERIGADGAAHHLRIREKALLALGKARRAA